MENDGALYFIKQAGIEKGPLNLQEVRRRILMNGNDHFLIRAANSRDWREAGEVDALSDLFTPVDTSSLTTKRETPSSKG